MLRLLLATATVLLLVGCSDDPSPAERRAARTEDLAGDLVAETDGALDDEQARCVAEALVRDVGLEDLDGLAEAARSVDDDDELRTTVVEAFAGCDALRPLLDQRDG